jgi:hypothetical protein
VYRRQIVWIPLLVEISLPHVAVTSEFTIHVGEEEA